MKIEKLLHIYSPPYEHADARIVGNRAGLSRLALTLAKAILENRDATTNSEDCVFATDGEGYEVKIIIMPDDSLQQLGDGTLHIDPEWAKYPPHYCDRGYQDDIHK